MEEKEKIKVYGVGELTAEIKKLLGGKYGKIYVEGEISGWKVYASGHAYFTIKDETAQLSCVMFASAIERCKAAARLRDGAKVCVYGRLDVYAPRGSYQMVVLAAKIAGEGELMARYNELKEKLEREGLFDRSRKRPLPFLPHHIAIVTSPSGAVIHDMCQVITRRFPNVEIRLFPVKVQDVGAKESIVDGIRFFSDVSGPMGWQPDVLIVGRGGGSVEDLWAFNEECVVRAVADSTIPVVSAVGHETDFTLCDFAADVRAGTPSIAAELVVPVKDELLQRVRELSDRLRRAPERVGETFAQRLDHLALRLSSVLGEAASRMENRLTRLGQRLSPAIDAAAARAERRLATASAKLVLLDPANPLKRGYSLTFDMAGRIVRRAADVNAGDSIKTLLGEGEVLSTVGSLPLTMATK